jgi:hypothetical protein
MTTALFETAFLNFAFFEFVASHSDSSNSRSRNGALQLASSFLHMPTVVTKSLSIKCFGDFAFHHSYISAFLWRSISTLQLPVSETCTKRCFSHFGISTFRHSRGEVFRHFQLPVSETCTKRCFSHFGIPTFRHSCGEVFRHFQLPVSETCTKRCFSHFGIPVVKCFDTSNSRYLELRNGVKSTVRYFDVSHFATSGLL